MGSMHQKAARPPFGEDRKAATPHGAPRCQVLVTVTSFTLRKAFVLSSQMGSRLTEDLCLPTYKQGSSDNDSKHIESILHDPAIPEAPVCIKAYMYRY